MTKSGDLSDVPDPAADPLKYRIFALERSLERMRLRKQQLDAGIDEAERFLETLKTPGAASDPSGIDAVIARLAADAPLFERKNTVM